jgi:hypothetical protein
MGCPRGAPAHQKSNPSAKNQKIAAKIRQVAKIFL